MSAVTDDAPELDIPDAPRLKIAGEEFECVVSVPHWSLMKLAKALTVDDDMLGLAAMYDFLGVLVIDSEWERFDTFMGTIDIEKSSLDHAIGDVIVQMSNRGKASAGSSSPSSGGLPTPGTPPTSRVVSFSQGTVRDVGQPSLSDAATSSTG